MNKINRKNNTMHTMSPAPLSAAIALALMANAPNAQATTTAGAQASTTAAQTSAQAQATTTAQTQAPQQITIEIGEPARLSALLEYALNELKQHSNHDIYWPASRLIMHSRDAEIEAQRTEVQQQLERIGTSYPEFAATLSQHVNSWQLGAQPYGALNLYKARQSIDHNPLLPAGNYTIILPARPEHIHVFGLTDNAGAQPFVAGQTARGFMLSQPLHEEHNPEHIYLQRNQASNQASKKASAKLPWGTHNAGGQQLQPGDILFIGPRQASAWGLLPFGKLANAIEHEEAEALEANLQALLRHIVPHSSQHLSQHPSQHVSPQQTQQPEAQQAASEPTQTQPAPAWRHLLRPHQLHTSNSWESQNASSLAPYHTEHARRLTYNNYGHFGLIQMPSARHAPAGAFNISYNDMNEYYRYTASIQMYDWLQASAFYLRVPNRLFSSDPSFSGNSIYTDKGFDVKFRLLKESAYLPEVSLGLVDMAGTGLLSSEYIAASKAFGPLDFTLGLGFGRMGSANNLKNPFCHIASTACDRPAGFSGRGGKFEVNQWFRGDAALFAGVEYQTPIDRLRLKIEYEGNDYSQDQAGITINPKTNVNVGATWKLNNTIDLSLNFERGDVLTFGFNIRPNFNRMSQIELMPNRPAAVLADQGQQPRATDINDVNWNRVGNRVRNQRAYSYEEFYISPAQG
ncbi:YjbH domain-containing protein [Aliidiomarina sp.]|uniref:YjbH domain-containing protein n=1 Tax=Aliidiomarina sp. TaxID=1872439 RepID=UPI003A4D4460